MAQIVATALAGEATRLTKIQQLKSGQLSSPAALSMPGGAQLQSAVGRDTSMTVRQPGAAPTPEEQMRQATVASTPPVNPLGIPTQ